MNKEEIIKLAQEAKLIRAGENYTEPARWGISEITNFYNRAAAAERNACVQIIEAYQIPVGNSRARVMTPQEIVRALEARGMTHHQIAKSIGVTQSSIWRIAAGVTTGPKYWVMDSLRLLLGGKT